MLQQFKNFQVNVLQLEDLLALSVFGKALTAEYEHFGVEPPDWVVSNLKTLNNTIQARVADAVDARIRAIDAQLSGLQTAEERRTALKAERDRLTKAGEAK